MKKRPSNPPTATHATVRIAKYDVLAIGASAGGFNALMEVLGGFDSDLRASVLVVQHLDPRRKSIIAELLSKKTAIPVKLAEHGERMLPGVVYIAPPDEHLLPATGSCNWRIPSSSTLSGHQLICCSNQSPELMAPTASAWC